MPRQRNIEAFNAIVAALGGQGNYVFNIDALNAWAKALGGVGNHRFNIDALNEVAGLYGAPTGQVYSIDALNAISGTLGGATGKQFSLDALAVIEPLAGGGMVLPSGFDYLTDASGAHLVDASGVDFIGQGAPVFSESASLASIAAARNIKFGTAFDLADYNADASYAALIQAQTSLYSPENDMKPSRIQGTEGVFSFTSADAFAARAIADGKSFRLHLLNYPAHDMAWVNNTTVTAANWQSKIDQHFEAVAARSWAQSTALSSIDVTNEIMDGSGLNQGYRTHPWYTAGGPGWVTYMFQKARALWPTKPLYLCHDGLEQLVGGYSLQQASDFKAMLTDQVSVRGAPIDGVNFQCHLKPSKGLSAYNLNEMCKHIKGLGLKIIIGEIDVRIGDAPTLATYSTVELDRVQAELLRRVLDVLLPHVNGGEVTTWGLSDTHHAWAAGERPLPYDTANVAKPMRREIRDALIWSR